MKLKNIGPYRLSLEDLNTTPGIQGTNLNINQEITVYDEDAEKSVAVKNMIDKGWLQITEEDVEPIVLAKGESTQVWANKAAVTAAGEAASAANSFNRELLVNVSDLMFSVDTEHDYTAQSMDGGWRDTLKDTSRIDDGASDAYAHAPGTKRVEPPPSGGIYVSGAIGYYHANSVIPTGNPDVFIVSDQIGINDISIDGFTDVAPWKSEAVTGKFNNAVEIGQMYSGTPVSASIPIFLGTDPGWGMSFWLKIPADVPVFPAGPSFWTKPVLDAFNPAGPPPIIDQNVGVAFNYDQARGPGNEYEVSFGVELAGVGGTWANFYAQALSATFPNDNNWHHVVVSANRTGNVLEIYVDNVLANVGPWVAAGPGWTLGDAMDTVFGGGWLYNLGRVIGLDDISLYKRALTSGDVATLFAGSTPSLPVNVITIAESLGASPAQYFVSVKDSGDVDYEISRDGGANWEAATLDAKTAFTEGAGGTDIKLKMKMTTAIGYVDDYAVWTSTT